VRHHPPAAGATWPVGELEAGAAIWDAVFLLSAGY
jgi:hypothetical protein